MTKTLLLTLTACSTLVACSKNSDDIISQPTPCSIETESGFSRLINGKTEDESDLLIAVNQCAALQNSLGDTACEGQLNGKPQSLSYTLVKPACEEAQVKLESIRAEQWKIAQDNATSLNGEGPLYFELSIQNPDLFIKFLRGQASRKDNSFSETQTTPFILVKGLMWYMGQIGKNSAAFRAEDHRLITAEDNLTNKSCFGPQGRAAYRQLKLDIKAGDTLIFKFNVDDPVHSLFSMNPSPSFLPLENNDLAVWGCSSSDLKEAWTFKDLREILAPFGKVALVPAPAE